MRSLLDTSVIIGMTERVDQTPSVRSLLEQARRDTDVLVSDVTLGELRHAIHAADGAARRLRALTYDLAESLTTVSVNADFATIEAYGAARTLEPRCSQNDTWIVALAARHEVTLHTEDDRMHRLANAAGVPAILVTSR